MSRIGAKKGCWRHFIEQFRMMVVNPKRWQDFIETGALEDEALTKCRLTRPPNGWRSGILSTVGRECAQEADSRSGKGVLAALPTKRGQVPRRVIPAIDYEARYGSGLR